MTRAPRHPDRSTVAQLIEDLRDEALDVTSDMDGIAAHETSEAEAAQVIEEFEAALVQIADGAPNPEEIARAALSLTEPLKMLTPPSDEDDTAASPDEIIRGLLKPRSV